ncbi:MAG: hypothetical protein Q9198_004241, partial [Flavoplaca austrocitrina]
MSGRAHSFTQPTKQKRQVPMLPGEMRNKIYKELLQAVRSDGALGATCLILDPATGELTEKPVDASKFEVLDVVPKSGVAKVFKLGIAQIRQVFIEFLSENAREMTFFFMHPGSLDNFAEMLRAYTTTPNGSQAVPLTVAISLFYDRKQFAKMAGWQETSMAHGYKCGAEEHVKKWMDAVQSLPRGVKLIVIIGQPWFDYRSLRGVTARLRAPDAPCTTSVAVQRTAWE